MNRYQRDYDNWLFEPYDFIEDEIEEEDFDDEYDKYKDMDIYMGE